MVRIQWRLLAAVSLVATSLSAEEPPLPRVEVVVTVEREAIPRDEAAAAVTLLDREQIERFPATSLAALMAYIPGVTMMFDSGANGPPMVTSRGFFGGGEVEYVKLLVDGVPQADAESGNVDWRRFRAAGIERIEILHGPGSALYGDTALGGVIQLYTGEESGGEIVVSGGSFGTRELDVDYATNVGAYRFSALASSAETGGARDHAAAHDRSLHFSLLRNTDRSRWRVDASGSRKDRREPGPLTREEIDDDRAQSNPLFQFDSEESDRRGISARFESFGKTELLASVHAATRDGETLRTLLLAPQFGTTALRDLVTRAYGATFEAGRGSMRAGLDVDRATLNGRYAAIDDDGRALEITAAHRGRRDRAGLFVTGAWNVCSRCRLSVALRRDDLRDRFGQVTRRASAWSPRAGLTVSLRERLSFFVQASHAFKAPTLDQLFDPRPYPDGAGGSFSVSNPDLRPQRARNFEAGLSGGSASSDFSVVAYRMQVTDEIDFDPQTFAYSNIGSALHRGIEASLAVAKTARVSPAFTYAWTRVADTARPDRQLKNIPEHVAQFLLHARLPGASTLDVVYRWTHGRSLDDEGLFTMPDVSRVDLRIAREFTRLRLHLDVLNALDAKYSEVGYVLFDFASAQQVALEFPAPGRMLRLGATFKF